MAKEYKTRAIQKNDTSANWEKAVNFVPLKGELILYTDLNKIKIGDGVTVVGDLPFSDNDKVSKAGDTMTGDLRFNKQMTGIGVGGSIAFGADTSEGPSAPSITGIVSPDITGLQFKAGQIFLGTDELYNAGLIDESAMALRVPILLRADSQDKGGVSAISDGVALSAENGTCLKVGAEAVTVCDNAGGAAQIKGVKDATEANDAVNLSQLNSLKTESEGAYIKKNGATAFQQLVSDDAGNVIWEDRIGGYIGLTPYATRTITFNFEATDTEGKYKANGSVAPWQDVGNYGGDFNVGDMYDITFNNVQYKSLSVTPKSENSSTGYLGDPELKKYPFCFGNHNEFIGTGMHLSYQYANISGNVDVTLTKYTKQIVKIPKEYVENPEKIIVNLDGATGAQPAIEDEKHSTFLSIFRNDNNNSLLILNADYTYITGSKPIISNGTPMRFQSRGSSWTVKDQYGLELGNGYFTLNSSIANSTKKFKTTMDDNSNLQLTNLDDNSVKIISPDLTDAEITEVLTSVGFVTQEVG